VRYGDDTHGQHVLLCILGYLVLSHYNFSELEKRHYYSSISKFATTILLLPDSRHFLRLPNVGPQCQTVFVYTCFVWFPLHSLTCGSHMSASFSTSIYLEAVRGWGGARVAAAPSSAGERRGEAPRSMAAGLPPRRRRPPCLPRRLLVRGGPGGRHSGQDAVGTALHPLLRCTSRLLPEACGAGEGEEAASLTSTRPNRPGFERIFTLAIDAPQLGEGRGEDAAPAHQRMSPAGHFALGRSPAADVAPLLLLHGRSGGRAHGLPLDDWRLRKKLTCGAHMSVSEEGTIRNMCVQIRSDNGT
jgi:hypothetical protein